MHGPVRVLTHPTAGAAPGAVRPLLLGEAPGRGKDAVARLRPLSGAIGVRLCRLAGLPEDDTAGTSREEHCYATLREAFDCANVLDHWPGPHGKGAAFPRALAEQGVRALVAAGTLHPGRVVVCLGRRVTDLFGRPGHVPFHRWFPSPGGLRLAGIPHPSGLTRNYNDPAERELARRTLDRARELTARAPHENLDGDPLGGYGVDP